MDEQTTEVCLLQRPSSKTLWKKIVGFKKSPFFHDKCISEKGWVGATRGQNKTDALAQRICNLPYVSRRLVPFSFYYVVEIVEGSRMHFMYENYVSSKCVIFREF